MGRMYDSDISEFTHYSELVSDTVHISVPRESFRGGSDGDGGGGGSGGRPIWEDGRVGLDGFCGAYAVGRTSEMDD